MAADTAQAPSETDPIPSVRGSSAGPTTSATPHHGSSARRWDTRQVCASASAPAAGASAAFGASRPRRSRSTPSRKFQVDREISRRPRQREHGHSLRPWTRFVSECRRILLARAGQRAVSWGYIGEVHATMAQTYDAVIRTVCNRAGWQVGRPTEGRWVFVSARLRRSWQAPQDSRSPVFDSRHAMARWSEAFLLGWDMCAAEQQRVARSRRPFALAAGLSWRSRVVRLTCPQCGARFTLSHRALNRLRPWDPLWARVPRVFLCTDPRDWRTMRVVPLALRRRLAMTPPARRGPAPWLVRLWGVSVRLPVARRDGRRGSFPEAAAITARGLPGSAERGYVG